MKIVIVKMKDDFVNIPADELKEENGFIYALNAGQLVGAFYTGIIEQIYLTEKKEKSQ